MRILLIGIVSALCLGGCATVSMAPASIMVSASATQEQSEFRESCSDFSKAIYERGLITERSGVSQVFNMLAFGDKVETVDTAYRERVQIESAPASVVFKTIEADAKWAASNLTEITDQVSDLLENVTDEAEDATLRKDIMAFEEAILLSKKARLSFLDAMGEFERRSTVERNDADAALAAFEASIDRASSYIERLAEAYAALSYGPARS